MCSDVVWFVFHRDEEIVISIIGPKNSSSSNSKDKWNGTENIR